MFNINEPVAFIAAITTSLLLLHLIWHELPHIDTLDKIKFLTLAATLPSLLIGLFTGYTSLLFAALTAVLCVMVLFGSFLLAPYEEEA
ncbi:MAG: hypothetical protein D6712_11575 [Chloroflexi bacterium]|nr:MAG: hypothetical protein D6712_11575 [Chloroflexota bacterium]